MTLRDYLGVLRQRWWLVIALTLLGGLAGSLFSVTRPPQFVADSVVYISVDSAGSVNDLSTGNSFAQEAASNFANIALQPYVLNDVARRLGVDSDAVSGRISTAVPVGTSIITIAATDQSALRATQLANAAADSLSSAVVALTPSSDSQSSVKVTRTTSATVPLEPVAPRPLLYILIATGIGLLLGIISAFVRHSLDTRVRSAEEAGLATGLPVIGTISESSLVRSTPCVFAGEPQDRYRDLADQFRVLRTNLEFVSPDRGLKTILICSSSPDEGKSTISINIAAALSAGGKRVLLIDGDLRRPRLAAYLGLEGEVGLSDSLVGRVDAEDAIQHSAVLEGSVLASGFLPPNPTELVQSNAMKSLLEDVSSKFDAVVIDGPPVLALPDSLTIANLVDGVVFVTSLQAARRGDLFEGARRLDQSGARVLGLVTNKAPLSATAYGYQSYNVS